MNADVKRLLLVSWGRGNGHISRLAAIGNAFRECGWQCTALTHDLVNQRDIIATVSDATRTYPSHVESADPWMVWSDLEFLRRSIEFDLDTIREIRPARVINDNRISMIIACAIESVPIVTLCQDEQLPGYCYPGEGLDPGWTESADSVNTVLGHHGLPGIGNDIRNLFTFGRIAIPNFEDFEPVASSGLDVVYTGFLSSGAGRKAPAGDALLFYRTVGAIDLEFTEAFGEWPGDVLVATGDQEMADELAAQNPSDRIHVAPLWDLSTMSKSLQAAVHHGGHGISTTCMSMGVPAVVLPGHNPERRANGERAARLGLGTVLRPKAPEGTRWGAAVDVTGDRPAWSVVSGALRAAVDEHRGADRANVTPGDLVNLLT